jgi:hypothetical protein
MMLFRFNQGSIATVTDYLNGNDLIGMTSYQDANASLQGKQQWEYIGTAAPTSQLTNGNGQATVNHVDGYTVLQLYNADGDFNADLTVRFAGTYEAQDIDLRFENAGYWTDPALLFG